MLSSNGLSQDRFRQRYVHRVLQKVPTSQVGRKVGKASGRHHCQRQQPTAAVSHHILSPLSSSTSSVHTLIGKNQCNHHADDTNKENMSIKEEQGNWTIHGLGAPLRIMPQVPHQTCPPVPFHFLLLPSMACFPSDPFFIAYFMLVYTV